MRKIINPVDDIVELMKDYFSTLGTTRFSNEKPFRSELFSTIQMTEHAVRLAGSHAVDINKKRSDKILKRLDANEELIIKVHELLLEAVKNKYSISPASEWMLDNYHLIKEQIGLGRMHLPKGYSETLPVLTKGKSEGLPRVYDIALEIISHSDGRIDVNTLIAFIEAYQSVSVLTIGELWAIPIMLRLSIIENLRRICSSIAIDRLDKNTALHWGSLLLETSVKEPKNLILVMADMARAKIVFNSIFVAEFNRKLQGKGQGLGMTLSWLEQRLLENGSTTTELVNIANQKQAADQVSVRNCIESLRLLKTTDWHDFVENVSVVEKILRLDNYNIYAQMDFVTRDSYRHVVENISKRSKLEEHEVAKIILDEAKAAKLADAPLRTQHVGYYLTDDSARKMIEKKAEVKPVFIDSLKTALKYNRMLSYAGAAILFTIILGLLAAEYLHKNGINEWFIFGITILGFIGFSHLTITVINWLATILVKPRPLPKMDFSKGIPLSCSTLVAVPCMLTSIEGIEEMTDALEVRFLANPDENLFFALLTDFTDAPSEKMPQDDVLQYHVKALIQNLNTRYKRENRIDIFYVFHRPRKWNSAEKVWMGYERKRGKLSELNSFLRNDGNDDFLMIVGDAERIKHVKYVIALDADTQMPRESAWKFIAAMAHPLNQPVVDEQKNIVVNGYGLLQPRVAVALPKVESSLYARLHANDSGLDPYTQVVSDVYQDLFAEGSFIGKGIYDIDIFKTVLSNRFPDNMILSHDLLEGSYVRSGLLTDVQLYEAFPETYIEDTTRHHRWIRGDWQIASWAFTHVPGKERRSVKNIISGLSRWKIADNLRRSLVPVALLLLLIAGWAIIPHPFVWTVLILIIYFSSSILNAAWHLIHKPQLTGRRQHIKEVAGSFLLSIAAAFFNIITLPYEAYRNMDAIIRTNWRMYISKKHLLEWTPSGIKKWSTKKSLVYTYSFMLTSVIISFFTFLLLYYLQELSLVTIVFMILWLLSPAIVWWVSRPPVSKVSELSEKQIDFLHCISRQTWSYFEDFVTVNDNWLPPDNFQQHPADKIAHRTSPTNIGVYVLSIMSAFDFGYVSLGKVVEKISNTFSSMLLLERFRGHFYNWYSTDGVPQTLHPKYISTVDSGNLAGHLLTLKQGLTELPDIKIFTPAFFSGLKDTLEVAKNIAGQNFFIPVLDILNKAKAADNNDVLLVLSKINMLKDEIVRLKMNEVLSQNDEAVNWLNKAEEEIRNTTYDIKNFHPWYKQLPIPEKYISLQRLNHILSLNEIVSLQTNISPLIKELLPTTNDEQEKLWLHTLDKCILTGSKNAFETLHEIERLMYDCSNFSDIDYKFLYDKPKHLLHIGYNADEDIKDKSYYDMLASEIRLGIFTGIAQGKLPQESWFSLSRLLTNAGITPVLLSWSGSMFEYLMPHLVMPLYPDTLLGKTGLGVIKNQIDYGRKHNIPWGISESGYNLVDANLNYQYQAFGIPGLGLKRGLSDELVVAPYATMLALLIDPEEAAQNLKYLSESGLLGKYGFYEAIDFTASRMPRGQSHVVLKSFMAHHQGMSFLALASTLLGTKMQGRFESVPAFKSTLLLLQEKVPKASNYYTHTEEESGIQTISPESDIRIINTPHTQVPQVQLLSNGRYNLMVSNAGGSFSKWKGLAINRWREDTTLDNWGIFCYIKDVNTGNYWSNTYQPTLVKPEYYEAVFSQGHAEFKRKDKNIETRTDIVVSPEDDIEIRRIKIANKGSSVKIFEITSYGEVVLAAQAADEAHPAFSNLFVQTKFDEEINSLLCTRRPRSKDEAPPWLFHSLILTGTKNEFISYETDRMKFIGRTNNIAAPDGIINGGALSNTVGSVLDPVMAIRCRIVIRPRKTVTFHIVTGIAETEEACRSLAIKYQDRHIRNRAFELSWTHSQVLLRQINVGESDAQLFNSIAGSVIYANASHRAHPDIINSNFKGQSGLWSYAISGDLPIVLLRIQNSNNIDLAKQLIRAHYYWRMKGLAVDLVIWNEDYGSYRQVVMDDLLGFITATSGAVVDQPGGIFIRSGDQIINEDRILLLSVARLVFDDSEGSIAEQMQKQITIPKLPPLLMAGGDGKESIIPELSLPSRLIFSNGIGGFTDDGKEYIILTSKEKHTPLPWVNVIANPVTGTVISESGQAYTWCENAHEYRLTPWHNDPICDKTGEAFYIRDDETGIFWSPTPLPCPTNFSYITRHGFGYSVFEHIANDIHSELWIYTDVEAPVKFCVLKLKNLSAKQKKLSAIAYIELVLGDTGSKTKMHIVTNKDFESGILFARNRYSSVFGERVCFFDTDSVDKTFTCDRTEFLGRNGSLQSPQAMLRTRLSGRSGAAFDPCIALQVPVVLHENEEHSVVFRLGAGKNEQEARSLALEFKGELKARQAQQHLHHHWNTILGNIFVKTPDKAFDIIANGWLVYQVLSSRVWARSGFYQSGGAFGFRDQLQDVLALMHTRPDLTRSQILLAATRQFREGDVQHWWHSPSGRGVRTACSDDYLWLPYVTTKYIQTTHDTKILDEYVSYIEGRKLHHGEESYYDQPVFLNHWETLYNHCKKAIKYGLKFGPHGLPLIGYGDWNDGMDKVGVEGKGESIWLAFFLYEILVNFGAIAEKYGDAKFAMQCKAESEKLKHNVNKNAWDGEWYRRAYFDDGTPLGSRLNEECKIDSISQSWSVLSGAGQPERSSKAMKSLNKHLVDKKNRIIKLLDPPFDKSDLYPGYIKGYVPGVRENGGQYTHAAIWAIMAFAVMKEKDTVWDLFAMINPVNRIKTEKDLDKYKAEPYVIAADVYGSPPHEGRGGWTWYTGSASWTYQLVINYILGFMRYGNKLCLNPCIPSHWDGFEVQYSFGNSLYFLKVKNNSNRKAWIMDGITMQDDFILLNDDGQQHVVEVFM